MFFVVLYLFYILKFRSRLFPLCGDVITCLGRIAEFSPMLSACDREDLTCIWARLLWLRTTAFVVLSIRPSHSDVLYNKSNEDQSQGRIVTLFVVNCAIFCIYTPLLPRRSIISKSNLESSIISQFLSQLAWLIDSRFLFKSDIHVPIVVSDMHKLINQNKIRLCQIVGRLALF